jgi:adenine-specific DNA-methyltransferase
MSTNISKQKRKDLTDKIKKIHKYIAGAKQDDNAHKFLVWLSEIEKELNAKKFGLVFEEHREAVDETLETHLPVLTENKKLFMDNGGQVNFLIEGDNLAALLLLLKTHKGKIDVIYIDPPYNRGDNDFIYDDNYISKSDGYIHSKWLSFMKMRLTIASKLLSTDGVIFLSIDDNEQANLKLLCDSIFDESNFAGMIPWRKRTAKTDVPFGISQDFEWVLVYAKSEKFKAFSQRKNVRKYFVTDDIPNRQWRAHDLTTQRTIEERPNSNFTIVNPKNGKKYPVNPNRVWAVTKETYPKFLAENRIVFPGDYPFLKIEKPQLRYFRDEDEIKALRKSGSITGVSSISTLLPQSVGMTEDGTSDLGELFQRKAFPFPKPVNLIKYIVQVGTINKNNAIILDFFAGSGTTGHAVMKLNGEDNGKRKFILCTNNENNICRKVTYERIKRVIKNEGYSASLKYYKIDFISISDKLYYEYSDDLLKHIRELVELENAINFTGNDKIAIILTEEEMDDFIVNIKKHKNCRKLYRGHDVLVTGVQKEKLKSAKIIVNVIPDYYYGDMEI